MYNVGFFWKFINLYTYLIRLTLEHVMYTFCSQTALFLPRGRQRSGMHKALLQGMLHKLMTQLRLLDDVK